MAVDLPQVQEPVDMEIVNEDTEAVKEYTEEIHHLMDQFGVQHWASILEMKAIVDSENSPPEWGFKGTLLQELLKLMSKRSSASGFYFDKKRLHESISIESIFTEAQVNEHFSDQINEITDFIAQESTIDLSVFKGKDRKDITFFDIVSTLFKSDNKNINEWEKKNFVNCLDKIVQPPFVFEDETLSKGNLVYAFNDLELKEFIGNGFKFTFRTNPDTGEKWVKLDFHFEILSCVNYIVSYLRAKGYFKETPALGQPYDIYVVVFKPKLEFNKYIGEVEKTGSSRYVSIADHYQLNALEVKSMLIIKFNPFNLKPIRDYWESSRAEQGFKMQRHFGGFHDIHDYGLDTGILQNIRDFETHQLVQGLGSSAVVDLAVNHKLEELIMLLARVERIEESLEAKDRGYVDGIKIAIAHCKKLKEQNLVIKEYKPLKVQKSQQSSDAGSTSRASK